MLLCSSSPKLGPGLWAWARVNNRRILLEKLNGLACQKYWFWIRSNKRWWSLFVTSVEPLWWFLLKRNCKKRSPAYYFAAAMAFINLWKDPSFLVCTLCPSFQEVPPPGFRSIKLHWSVNYTILYLASPIQGWISDCKIPAPRKKS